MSAIVVWLRRDLRLQDNPALHAALASGEPVMAVYIRPDRADSPLAEGTAANCYLHHSLLSLQSRLETVGVDLHLQRGDPAVLLPELCRRHGAVSLHCNRIVDPRVEQLDERVRRSLESAGTGFIRHDDDCLLMPDQALKEDGTPYRVFTPFWRKLQARLRQTAWQERLLAAPGRRNRRVATDSQAVQALGLLPAHPWQERLAGHWDCGEPAALDRLERFLAERVSRYQPGRDFPDRDATSRLAPALHFGEVAAVRIHGLIEQALEQGAGEQARRSLLSFQAQIGWREFARHRLHASPHTRERSLDPRFDQPSLWLPDPGNRRLRAWQRGQTGYGLVDAGMRQLWETGWMHNRVRMVTASFLTKNLGIHWQQGASWFRYCLVDADDANNTMGWQWVAGCGADAAPYYRIFNPELQARRHDPEQRYRRRWLGERSDPPVVVDLQSSRARALERYRGIL